MLRNFGIRIRILFLLGLLVLSTLLASGAFVSGLHKLASRGTDDAVVAMQDGYERMLKFSVQTMTTKVGDAVEKAK
ncbi:MAG: hypothetical protein JEY79_00885 [Pseudodesulfovibrio sp.]|nr:hypothetical protein [Pseudodesulfovibrio sp.]